MSSSTWTPDALSSSARPAAGTCWRVIEAQHHVSTAKLTDTAAEQTRLEELIETSKPVVPEECRHLHYLLHTPFRYGAPYPRGSRFRRAGLTLGVFYAAIDVSTAIAELAFYRLLFFAESPATPWPANAGEYTAFSVAYASGRAIDLTLPPFSAHAAQWQDTTNYAACQELAEQARAAEIQVITYRSVRDPAGLNLAILSCLAFTMREPTSLQTWRIQLGATGVIAVREFPKLVLSYDRSTFKRDPRIARMKWDRPAGHVSTRGARV